MKNQIHAEADSDPHLAELEKTIAKGPEAVFDACKAMRVIIDNQLYKNSHRSLERYLRDRFAMCRSRGYQMADWARVMENLSTKVDKNMLPKNERQVRQLVKLPEDEQLLHWLSVRKETPARKQSATELDRYQKLSIWLANKYLSWPLEGKLKFIETVEELMGDMRREL